MDSVLSSTTNKSTLTVPSPGNKNNLKSTQRISQYILWGTVFSNGIKLQYIRCFQWFSIAIHDAIVMTSIPLKVYGTPKFLLDADDHESENTGNVHISPAKGRKITKRQIWESRRLSQMSYNPYSPSVIIENRALPRPLRPRPLF